MKKIYVIIFSSIVLFYACSTEVDLNADWEEVTIVYGLLDVTDSVHHIKVNKAFLGELPADQMAKKADSLYHNDSIIVEIKELDNNGNPTGNSTILQRTELPGKEDGTFASTPNYLYTFNDNNLTVKEDRRYKIEITNNASGEVVTSTTPMTNTSNIKNPDLNNLLDKEGIRFIGSKETYSIRWLSGKDAIIYEVEIRINYKEGTGFSNNSSNPTIVRDTFLTYTVGKVEAPSTEGDHSMEIELFKDDFYRFINQNLDKNTNLERVIDSLDFYIYGGARDLQNYITINQAQTGITETQIRPHFTNIENGLGLFSSKVTITQIGIPLHLNFIDTLACGPVTRDLNFLRITGYNNTTGEPTYRICQ